MIGDPDFTDTLGKIPFWHQERLQKARAEHNKDVHDTFSRLRLSAPAERAVSQNWACGLAAFVHAKGRIPDGSEMDRIKAQCAKNDAEVNENPGLLGRRLVDLRIQMHLAGAREFGLKTDEEAQRSRFDPKWFAADGEKAAKVQAEFEALCAKVGVDPETVPDRPMGKTWGRAA